MRRVPRKAPPKAAEVVLAAQPAETQDVLLELLCEEDGPAGAEVAFGADGEEEFVCTIHMPSEAYAKLSRLLVVPSGKPAAQGRAGRASGEPRNAPLRQSGGGGGKPPRGRSGSVLKAPQGRARSRSASVSAAAPPRGRSVPQRSGSTCSAGAAEAAAGQEDEAQPTRPLAWVLRLLDEYYTYRTANFLPGVPSVTGVKWSAALFERRADAAQVTTDDLSATLFQFLHKKFGLDALVLKAGGELLRGLKAALSDLEVAAFHAMLTSNAYDTVDAFFHLAARAALLPFASKPAAVRRSVSAAQLPRALRKALAPYPPLLLRRVAAALRRPAAAAAAIPATAYAPPFAGNPLVVAAPPDNADPDALRAAVPLGHVLAVCLLNFKYARWEASELKEEKGRAAAAARRSPTPRHQPPRPQEQPQARADLHDGNKFQYTAVEPSPMRSLEAPGSARTSRAASPSGRASSHAFPASPSPHAARYAAHAPSPSPPHLPPAQPHDGCMSSPAPLPHAVESYAPSAGPTESARSASVSRSGSGLYIALREQQQMGSWHGRPAHSYTDHALHQQPTQAAPSEPQHVTHAPPPAGTVPHAHQPSGAPASAPQPQAGVGYQPPTAASAAPQAMHQNQPTFEEQTQSAPHASQYQQQPSVSGQAQAQAGVGYQSPTAATAASAAPQTTSQYQPSAAAPSEHQLGYQPQPAPPASQYQQQPSVSEQPQPQAQAQAGVGYQHPTVAAAASAAPQTTSQYQPSAAAPSEHQTQGLGYQPQPAPHASQHQQQPSLSEQPQPQAQAGVGYQHPTAAAASAAPQVVSQYQPSAAAPSEHQTQPSPHVGQYQQQQPSVSEQQQPKVRCTQPLQVHRQQPAAAPEQPQGSGYQQPGTVAPSAPLQPAAQPSEQARVQGFASAREPAAAAPPSPASAPAAPGPRTGRDALRDTLCGWTGTHQVAQTQSAPRPPYMVGWQPAGQAAGADAAPPRAPHTGRWALPAEAEQVWRAPSPATLAQPPWGGQSQGTAPAVPNAAAVRGEDRAHSAHSERGAAGPEHSHGGGSVPAPAPPAPRPTLELADLPTRHSVAPQPAPADPDDQTPCPSVFVMTDATDQGLCGVQDSAGRAEDVVSARGSFSPEARRWRRASSPAQDAVLPEPPPEGGATERERGRRVKERELEGQLRTLEAQVAEASERLRVFAASRGKPPRGALAQLDPNALGAAPAMDLNLSDSLSTSQLTEALPPHQQYF